MTATEPRPARPRWVGLLTWLPRIALFLVFLGAGFSKLFGEAAMVDMFATIGAGQGLRYVVGGAEVAGAIGVLIPRLAALAAAGLAVLMIGATITNLTVLDASPVFPLVLLVVAAGTCWLLRRRLNPLAQGRPASAPAT